MNELGELKDNRLMLRMSWIEQCGTITIGIAENSLMFTYEQALQLRLMLDYLFSNPYDRDRR